MIPGISGAILGAFGAGFNRLFSFAEAWQQSKIEEKSKLLDLEIAKINADRDAIVASYQDLKPNENSHMAVNDILKLFRPLITICLLILVSVFFFCRAGTEDQNIIIASFVDLCAMAVSWWFGSRPTYRK